MGERKTADQIAHDLRAAAAALSEASVLLDAAKIRFEQTVREAEQRMLAAEKDGGDRG